MTTIVSNYQERSILDAHDLTAKEKKQLNYFDWSDSEVSGSFFRYRGEIYDLDEFSTTNGLTLRSPEFAEWHGYQADSYFSGILVRYPDSEYDYVIVGRYFT